MQPKLAILAAGLLLAASLVVPVASAQEPGTEPTPEQQPQQQQQTTSTGAPTTTVTIAGNEKTAANEMGWTRMLNQIELTEGCTAIDTVVHFNTYLAERHGTYFMFQVIWNTYPVEARNIRLETDLGQNITLFQQGPEGTTAYKLVVLARDMPALGTTDLHLKFDACSTVKGLQEIGTIVMVFDETWTKVKLSGGIDAEIFNSAKLLVMSGEETGPGTGLSVPGPGMVMVALGLIGTGAIVGRKLRR
ncbi:MAG TPA: hypothetical protein VNZ52_03510 [Candidatus Thermoplasmatota archaeon]|nr:hypothetical protein [Candidatus Thermoplasmatota archaeon]